MTASMAPWFGVYLPQLRMEYPTILERTLAAEAVGFHSAWFMDHMAAPMRADADTLEGWSLVAALAAVTTHIRLGHLVTADPFRHPAVLAKMAATVDVISGGRLELGVGWGSVPAELETYGITHDTAPTRAARLAESLTVMQLMFSGETFDFDGTFFTLRGASGRPTPVQDPLPIHIGGVGPKLTMPLVRGYAHYWNCPCYGADRFAELKALAGDARATLQRPVALARTAAERDDVVALGQKRFGSWGGLVAGTADEVAAVLRADVAAGVEGFILQFTDFGATPTLEHFMAEVAPQVRA